MKNKFFFTFLATMLMTASAWAETISTINPTWEGNYRTNGNTPTGWTKVTTTDAQFEIYNGARFFAVQTWEIADINHVTSLKFVYPRVDGQTNNGDVSLWVFPYNSMVTSTANYNTQGVAFLNDVQTVLGVMPGNTITNAPLLTSSVESINGKHCRVFNIDSDNLKKLIAAGNIDNNTLSVNILLNTKDATNNYKYYHTASGETPASYCDVTTSDEVVVPAIRNKSTWTGYSDLATAVAEATAGDVLIINEDVTISGSRVEIKKALTIQGATGEEKLICDVPANQLMILANDNTANYEVTFRNLVIDGKNIVRSTQTIDSNNKATLVFDGVKIINTNYSVTTADIKSNGGNVVLKGNNSFSTGIYLNKNKRIDGKNATHTAENPIHIMLAGDYDESWAIVLNCTNTALYTAVDADWYDRNLYVSNNELKGTKILTKPAIRNTNNWLGYSDSDISTAVSEANAGNILIVNSDVTVSDSRVEIKKALTIQGATGAEKLVCGVPANTLMVLANHNQGDYDVTFKNLTVDGGNVERSTQMFDANNNGRLVFENVKVINSKYSVATGDVKSNNREVVLRGDNSFATGIYLNSGKRISNEGTTHTTPIPVILAGDYANDYAIVLTCNDANLYTVKDADGVTGWELKVVQSGTKYELKGYVVSYDLHVSAAKMATLVLAYDAVLPAGVQAYTLTNDGSELIDAEEVTSITANEPVLVVAEENTYTFERGESEYNQATKPASGGLVGSYKNATAIAQKTGDNYNYILANDAYGVGFYRVGNDCTINKNRAYLSCGYNNAAAPSAPMRIQFRGHISTGMVQQNADEQVEKCLINGRLVIRKAGRVYSMDGRCLE